MIEPFDKLTKKDRAALTEEGERLVRFVEPKAKSFGDTASLRYRADQNSSRANLRQHPYPK